VSSAVYGLVLSMGICIVAVAIFTGNIGLLAITVSTLLGNVLCTLYHIVLLILTNNGLHVA